MNRGQDYPILAGSEFVSTALAKITYIQMWVMYANASVVKKNFL